MINNRMKLVINFILFQGLWFLAILGQNRFEWVIFGVVFAHIALQKNWRQEAFIILSTVLVGTLVDSLLTVGGIFVFTPSPDFLPIPLWLIGLWSAFAATLLNSLNWVFSRPLLSSLLAGVSGPLSYFAGERLGAVTLPQDIVITTIILAFTWAALMQIFRFLIFYAGSSAYLINRTVAVNNSEV